MTFRKVALGVVLGGLVVIAVASLVFLGAKYSGADSQHREEILIKTAIDVAVLSIASLIAYFTMDRLGHLSNLRDLQRRVVGPIVAAIGETRDGIYTRVADIPWQQLFANSNSLYIMVQGWDGWLGEVAAPLREFLGRGGKVSILLPAIPQAGEQSAKSRNLALITERLGVQAVDQVGEIEGTAHGLEQVVEEVVGKARAKGQLIVAYTDKMNWFCGMYFAPHSLLISVYQHKHRGIKIPTTIVPSFVVPLSQVPKYAVLREWFAIEWQHLTGRAPW